MGGLSVSMKQIKIYNNGHKSWFWRFCTHARRQYNFTCYTSPHTPHAMLKILLIEWEWGTATRFEKSSSAFLKLQV